MPTASGTPSAPLTPQQTLEKFASFITETGDEPPATPDATVETPTAASSEAAPPATPPDDAEPAAQDEATPDEPRYLLTVDGEAVEVDLDELKASYTMKGHNTRVAQKNAERERELETERSAATQEREQYRQMLGQLTQALERLQGEPDWDALHKQLPADKFLEQKAEWERSQAQMQRLRAEEDRVAQVAAQDQARTHEQYVKTERDRLVAAIPEWQKPETLKADVTKLYAALQTYGFTDQQIRGTVDHRLLLLARDAMRYRELHREAKPDVKLKVSSIRTARPGTPERPRPNAKQEQLIAKAAQTHRGMDAARAIESLLGD